MSDAVATRKARKSKRDPQLTREAILEVAGKLLAKDGPEGLSVSQVAQLAGVNRGTAYHHFPTRETLIDETKAWVSRKLMREVFGDVDENGVDAEVQTRRPREVIEKLANFAMENPEFGRVWLYEVLSSNQAASDPFWARYRQSIDDFVESDYAQPDIDAEVHAVILLVGVFLWPVWANAHSSSANSKKKMAQRFTDEMLRLSLHGTLLKEKFPELLAEEKGKKKSGRKSK
ncbi:TetR/AcrR family transcriptional regulator [Litorivivens sp.]|uniref:TetR/AcrR family transcriptional regulator n=1 Tax=Litorivivens sp. TaxID=2020868 RepID=UPI00356A224A